MNRELPDVQAGFRKGKGKNERYTHLNAEFQRIARKDKKAFLHEQCKEIEENNRMGKTRDLFKRIRDTKGIFYAKMGSIKDRNVMDPTEAEDIKKRWREYTEELNKKDLNDADNHDGVITHLETDILKCEVKWGLGSITMNKASGGDGISVELFQILKDDGVKVLCKLLNAGRGHQAPRKAAQSLQKEVRQNTKDENCDKRFRDGDLSSAGSHRGDVSTQ